MDKWTSYCSPNLLHGLRSQIWIQLPQLPIIYWDIKNITHIANALGEPLWMDSHTSSWGRSSFACICVRIDISKKLIPGVWINGIQGRFFQRVEYEGLTNLCFECGSIGHSNGRCHPNPSSKGHVASCGLLPQPPTAKALGRLERQPYSQE